LKNNQENFQLHRFTTRENITGSCMGYFFDSHCKLRSFSRKVSSESVLYEYASIELQAMSTV